jgi:two-component system, LytTR family, sensor kinase
VHGLLYLTAVRLAGIEENASIGVAALAKYALRHAGGDLATIAVLVGVYLLFDARQRAHAREVAATALEARAAAADLEVLRGQLQPHFLFNALNTVSTLVLRGDNAGADLAIGRISRYLRSALAQRADAVVSVRDEMADVSQYFAIERLRFGDSLCLDVRIADEAREVRIPALIVQPLVENAVRHGHAAASEATRIGVSAMVHDSRLLLRVCNAARAEVATDGETMHGEGFGLRYVRERLRLFYGAGASVTLAGSETETVVTISVPLAPHPPVLTT